MQEGEGGSGHLPPLFSPPSSVLPFPTSDLPTREEVGVVVLVGRWYNGEDEEGGKLLLRSRTDDGRLRLLHLPGRSRPSLTVLPPSHAVRSTRGDMQSEGERMDGDGIKGVRCGILQYIMLPPAHPTCMGVFSHGGGEKILCDSDHDPCTSF